MKLAKSLFLGSAAGLVAVAGAQAADLPVRAAAPVDYVRTCPNAPIGGTGFFVIPGTETCLRISGRVRAEYLFGEKVDFLPNRQQDQINFFVRGQVNLDARTATEYGTLRSFISIQANDLDGTRATVLDQAFIQFANFTAGRINSFFTFFDGSGAFGGNLMTSNAGVNDQTTELLAYTALFGPGISASVSVENGRNRRTAIAGPIGGNIYGGQELPDLVANLNVSQAWGAAQIMGALHQVRHGVPNVNISDELGWALGAGVRVNLPMIAAGDALWLQAVYTDGAINYSGAPTTVSEFTIARNDAFTNTTNTGLVTTEAWSVVAAFRHFWHPTVWQDIQGAYGEVDIPSSAAGQIPVGVNAPPVLANMGYDWWQLGTAIHWRPVGGLTVSADVVYTDIDPNRRVVKFANGAPVVPAATVGDGSNWAGRLRIQRDF